jgi:hypothetical protein
MQNKKMLGTFLRFTKSGYLMISEYRKRQNVNEERHQIIPIKSISQIIGNPGSIVLVSWK